VPYSLQPTINAKEVEEDRRNRAVIMEHKIKAYQKKQKDI